MSYTYLFYDTETTGLNLCFDQVIQFAAIRTDMNFNTISEHEFYISLNPDVIPSPYAFATHQISLQQSQQGMKEPEAMRKIQRLFCEPKTINIGYNNLGFDDEILRFSFFRNLLPSYDHQFAQGCYRMDMYPITAFYCLYNKDILQWPEKDGEINLKLANLSELNHLASGQAHNALVDVKATVALAKKLAADTKMWQYCANYFVKKEEQKRLQAFIPQSHILPPALLINGRYGFKNNFQIAAICLGQHEHYRNQSCWLRLDADDLSQLSIDEITQGKHIIRKKNAEPPFTLPFGKRHNRIACPERNSHIHKNLQWLQENTKNLKDISEMARNYTYPKIPQLDCEAALYTLEFLSQHDRGCFDDFHRAENQYKWDIALKCHNRHYHELAMRLMGRHYHEELPKTAQDMFAEYINNIFSSDSSQHTRDYRNQLRPSIGESLEQCEQLQNDGKLTTQQLAAVEELKQYLQQVKKKVCCSA